MQENLYDKLARFYVVRIKITGWYNNNKNIVTCTMLVDAIVHPCLWSYTRYLWKWYYYQ